MMKTTSHVRIIGEEILSNNWYLLKKTTFDFQRRDGSWQQLNRETYDRGNGAVLLLHHAAKHTVILTRQFRFPTFVNGNADGYLIEACAGLLDADDAETCIRREVTEETGYRIREPKKIFEAYMILIRIKKCHNNVFHYGAIWADLRARM
jgi:GDP-mannose pyrophosphatase NudK